MDPAPSSVCGGLRKTSKKSQRRSKTRRLIKIQKSGDLKKYGYEKVVTLTKEERETALKKAIKAYGSLTVLKKVNAIRVLTKRTNPKLSKVLGEDVKFIQELHADSKE
jgi:hypothetical protein